MKKSQLVSAIKNVLAENKKQKLDENTIRQLIREVLSEEAYDTVRDVKSALGHNPTQEDVEEYLGRSLDSDEMDAFGFQIAIGRRNGQPMYASKKPTRYPTYTKRRGGY
jgi:hypothetical protein